MPPLADLLVAALGALVAGVINSVAGGGTLVSFPALVAVGVPSLSANVTNTVALGPGYFGAALAQREALEDNRHRLRALLPAAGLGGLVGSVLLVITSQRVFDLLVPFLILLACGLLGFQDQIKSRVFGHRLVTDHAVTPLSLVVAVFVTAIYGGYFGAGIGIMLLSVLGLLLDGELPRLNALKQVLSLVINVVAAVFFVFTGKVEWGFAVVMAPASLIGGHLGGSMVGRMNPRVMRAVVISFGVVVALKMLLT